MTYKAWHSNVVNKVLLMLVRGLGIRDVVGVEQINIKKVLLILVNLNKEKHYDALEVDLCRQKKNG